VPFLSGFAPVTGLWQKIGAARESAAPTRFVPNAL
jgi:hypothetical protein